MSAAPDNVTNLPVARPVIEVSDPIPVLDTSRYEQMMRIATVMARSSLCPQSLIARSAKDDRGKTVWEYLDPQTQVANCFQVVNQAVRWGVDPFAAAQCASVVHGKLMWEGKLVHAIIEKKAGVRLNFKWNDAEDDNLRVVVSGKFPDEAEARTVSGTLAEWRSSGDAWKSDWASKRKMLAYRGSREWARLHAPIVMLGVYTPDEFEDLADNARAERARDVTAKTPPVAPQITQNVSAPIMGVRPAKAPPVAPVQGRSGEAYAPAVKQPPVPPMGKAVKASHPDSQPVPQTAAEAAAQVEEASFVDLVDKPAPAKTPLQEYDDALAACTTSQEFDDANLEWADIMNHWTRADRDGAADVYARHAERFA